jgi:hypothetical protein
VSALMVPEAHITAMLNGAMTLHRSEVATGNFTWYVGANPETASRELTLETAGTVGAMLLAENQSSVNHLYHRDEIESPYLFVLDGHPVDPVRILKAVDCYTHQSCEHPGWESSESRAFCDTLTHLAIRRLPGYGEAPWMVERMADVHLKRRR